MNSGSIEYDTDEMRSERGCGCKRARGVYISTLVFTDPASSSRDSSISESEFERPCGGFGKRRDVVEWIEIGGKDGKSVNLVSSSVTVPEKAGCGV